MILLSYFLLPVFKRQAARVWYIFILGQTDPKTGIISFRLRRFLSLRKILIRLCIRSGRFLFKALTKPFLKNGLYMLYSNVTPLSLSDNDKKLSDNDIFQKIKALRKFGELFITMHKNPGGVSSS